MLNFKNPPELLKHLSVRSSKTDKAHVSFSCQEMEIKIVKLSDQNPFN